LRLPSHRGPQSDGTLWAWGDNSYGQLGQGNTNGGYTGPTQVGTATNWVAVASGNLHTVALKSDGTLWAWGDNTHGDLGLGERQQRLCEPDGRSSQQPPIRRRPTTAWVAVACGQDHTGALRSDGTLWAWGNNSDGELGQGNATNSSA